MSMRGKTCRGAVLMLLVAMLAPTPALAQELAWEPFEQALATADSTARPVLVDVWAPWCGWCHKMKREVYPSDGVRGCLAEEFVLTRLNRDDTDVTHRYRGQQMSPVQLAQTFRAESVPTVVLLNADGEYLLHLPGFIEAPELQWVLGYVASGAYERQSFAAYRGAHQTPPC